MKLLARSIAAVCLFLPAVALADDPEHPAEKPPSTGVGMMVAGGVFTGLGALNLLTSPVCLATGKDVKTICLGASLGAGGTFLLIGIPLLAVGSSRRAEYKAWQRRTGMTPGFEAHPGGAAATWSVAF